MHYNHVVACGRVAQLGEHLLCKQGVAGSNPVTSTNLLHTYADPSLVLLNQAKTAYAELQ